MNSGWRRKRLGDICEILATLVDPREPEFINLPHIGAGNMISGTGELTDIKTAKEEGLKSGKYTFDRSMVLYSKIRPYLMKVARPAFSGLCSADVYPLSPDTSQLDRDFLFHLLLTQEFTEYAIAGSSRAGMPKVNRDHLFNFTTYIPPLLEQKRIVAILDEAFEGIDRAIANTKKNLINTRELFESYLNSQLLTVASSTPSKTLSCIADLIIDCEHKTAPTQETGIPSIRTPNIGKGYLIFDKVNRVSEETYELWTRRAKPQPGDLILAREAPAGNVGVIPEGQRVCLGQRTVLIRPKKETANSQYLAFLLLHPIMQARLLAHSTGATVQHVNMKDIRELPISELPSVQAQVACVEELEATRSQVNRLEVIYQQKLAALSELKQSILQKAFTGELTADTTTQATKAVKEVVAA